MNDEACCAAEPMRERPVEARNELGRRVSFKQLNYGFLIDVDCHQFAIENKEKLILLLTEYINNQTETEKKWFTGKLL